ncbi:MAG: TusE/DsrC/DsvC family sulfur relay protein [Gammaproteobacteria bacterium]|nr:TusE/DsrC/DsvC family sulfur relay protein [Gammaproteobacteria bacterium]
MRGPICFEARTVEIAGKSVILLEHGYLFDREEWSPAVVEFLAKVDGVTLTEWHWWLIGYLRSYYHEYRIVPARSILCRALEGTRDQGNPYVLEELFPDETLLPIYSGMPYPASMDTDGRIPRYRGIGRKVENPYSLSR